MKEKLRDYIGQPCCDVADLDTVTKTLGVSFPEDYRSFLLEYGGGEGFVGAHYVIFWGVDEIIPFNKEYEVDKYASGLLLIGSNGGGEGFCFDLRSPSLPIVMVPFIGMELEQAKLVAPTFSGLIQKMSETSDELF